MKTLIVDNYDSFTFNLLQMVAAIDGELPMVVHNDSLTWQQLLALNPDSIIISPGPGRPENARDFGICRQIILEASVPVLGVCLGFQGIAHLFGGTIERAPEPVHGRSSRIFHDGNGLFAGIPQGFSAVRYHSLTVRNPIPRSLRTTAWTSEEMPMALEHVQRPLWGVQFHPESISTDHGSKMLENFRRLSRQRSSYIPSVVPSAVASEDVSESPRNIEVKENGDWRVSSRKLHQYASTEATFCSLFGDEAPAFWLDSAQTSVGRFSFMGSASGPSGMWLSYFTEDNRLELHSAGRDEVLKTPLLDFLQSELDRRTCSSPELPFDFNGGFVGYFGYELKAECGGRMAHRSPHADACLIFADRMIAFDHKENSVYLVYAGRRDEVRHAETWFNEMERRFESGFPQPPAVVPADIDMGFHADQTHERYLESVGQCLEFIRDGESYEICLTNQLTAKAPLCPLNYYRGLRRSNPAPNSAFLRFPDVSVACSSPERFLKIDPQRLVESRPIKGTLKRTANAAEDRQLREQLRTNVKTRSENLMIVDLLRNDLGRVCEVGSVHVPQMMEVETYTNLHQLVSTVRGRLRQDMKAIDCLRSAFPGGSMTGAPKIRTMELIDQLESSARGIYSGAIGFLGLNGSADLNIVIRTAVFSGGNVSIGVGGAVVALSNPEAEFEESILKGRALIDAFRPLITGKISSY
jgi:para-aminobenzoate synthetase